MTINMHTPLKNIDGAPAVLMANAITGGAGNDRFDSAAGADKLFGGLDV